MFSIFRFIGAFWVRLFYRIKIIGAGNIPRRGGGVLCANHVYAKDLIVLGCAVKRKVRWMAKAELFKNPFIGKFLKGLGAFPVKRGMLDREAVRTTYDLLSKGEIVGIFPEGTRNRNKEDRTAGKRGFVSFSLKARVPIIPVSLVYGKGPFKKNQLFSKIKVVIHEQRLLEFDKKYDREEMDAISSEIMKIIYSE